MLKQKLLVLCGGKSAEHSISLVSTWNLLNVVHQLYDCTLIAISKDGQWYLQDCHQFLQQEPNPLTITIPSKEEEIIVRFTPQKEKFYNLSKQTYLEEIDVVFPLLHGTNGEDGNLQGVLNQLQLPYVGCDVLGSAICMDKDVAKRLMLEADLPTSDFITMFKEAANQPTFEEVSSLLGSPIFVKPANLGSSVGITKVSSKDEFEAALNKAFSHDRKVIVEEFVDGIEVECAVLGNDEVIVSQPGCYVHTDEFFDFDTKYINNEAVMEIPAQQLTEVQRKELQDLALKTYYSLECQGLSRVDIFVTKQGDYFINEVNTMPGFTQNSMYPLLIEHSGISYPDLVKKLCDLAIHRFKQTKQD